MTKYLEKPVKILFTEKYSKLTGITKYGGIEEFSQSRKSCQSFHISSFLYARISVFVRPSKNQHSAKVPFGIERPYRSQSVEYIGNSLPKKL